MKDFAIEWAYLRQSKFFALIAVGIWILSMVGAQWLRFKKGQPITARDLLNWTLGYGLFYNLCKLAQAWHSYPTTAHPPLAFWAWCLPVYGVFFTAAALLLPGRLRLSVFGLWLSVSAIWLLCNIVLWCRPGEVVVYEGDAYSAKHRRSDPRLGFALVPNADVRSCKKVGGQVIYDVRYGHDQAGRRKTMVATSPTRSLLCFGCSFTYGEGVNDAETWPAAVSRQHPGVIVYNYACGGWGPAQMLDQIELRKLEQEVTPAPYQAVYLFLPDHQRRVIGSWQFDSTWGASLSRYRLRDGQPQRLGPMASTQDPWQFLVSRTLEGSGFLGALRMDRPLRYTSQDLDLVAAIFQKSQQELNQQLGDCPLTVLFYPTKAGAAREDLELLRSKLHERSIRTMDLQNLLPHGLPVLPKDEHPTAAGQELLGKAIGQALYGAPQETPGGVP